MEQWTVDHEDTTAPGLFGCASFPNFPKMAKSSTPTPIILVR